MRQAVLTAILVVPAVVFGHASGNGHVHTTSMGDSGSGFSNNALDGGSASGYGQMPGALFGGLMPPAAPPPPPPPALSAPAKKEGNGDGVVSKVKLVGRPGDPMGGNRPVRSISSEIYSESGEQLTSREEV